MGRYNNSSLPPIKCALAYADKADPFLSRHFFGLTDALEKVKGHHKYQDITELKTKEI